MSEKIVSPMSEKSLEPKSSITEDGRLKGYFFSKTVYNLSKKILTKTEMRVLEKGLDYAPIQKNLKTLKSSRLAFNEM